MADHYLMHGFYFVSIGSNAIVTYTLLGVDPPGPTDPFNVSSSTGVIRKAFDLDREVAEEYRISIQVH